MVIMSEIKHFFMPRPLDSPRLSLHGIGVREVMAPGIVHRPGGTGDHLWMFFHDPVTLRAGGEARACPADTLILWGPRHGHYYGDPAQPWTHSWLHADGSDLAALLAESGLPRDTPLPLPDADCVERFLRALYHEVTAHTPPEPRIARNLLDIFLCEVRRTQAERAAPVPPRVRATLAYLAAHYAEPHCLADLAARVHLSVPHFCSEFTRHAGAAPFAYLIRLRLHHAAYLLRDHHLTITDVAHRVGYPDLYHFSKLFKKHLGMSPRTFRGREG